MKNNNFYVIHNMVREQSTKIEKRFDSYYTKITHLFFKRGVSKVTWEFRKLLNRIHAEYK